MLADQCLNFYQYNRDMAEPIYYKSPIYHVLEHSSCYRVSWQMQAFCAIKLLCSGT